ncbi:hypothetical protein CDV52_20095 [Haematobacter missouriensis]|uniref:Uncharacterized protein n=2 Tax=Haematobacter TaxID=366614 RepID=A0A212AHJ1_9RHOB|nr:hypothetical protein CDV50_16870 [Haematobacter massiliensis]OWJ77637.1 hypothetical protein CDV49_11125 [Haematobacter genomosp. 1]OWJ80978.1 hypothetical protein CDV52_20095 [Haematobacter missouriensis]OWJ86859.1 hypothetical protein CDV51_09255 [Haematobacter massiliensis]
MYTISGICFEARENRDAGFFQFHSQALRMVKTEMICERYDLHTMLLACLDHRVIVLAFVCKTTVFGVTNSIRERVNLKGAFHVSAAR